MKTDCPKKGVLGILGGLGPLASAEFVRTIYDYGLGECEQESPLVVMYSDPSFPDRTEALLGGAQDILLDQLIQALHRLCRLGASKIVICCMTMHYLLPRLPQNLREQIASLLDVVFDQVVKSQRSHLLLCTIGTRKLNLFQSHKQWELGKEYFVLPDTDDQNSIHNLIYLIKKNHDISELVPTVEKLLAKYQVDSFIAGCTELHLLARHSAFSDNRRGYSCVDPLTVIAKGLRNGTYEAREYSGVI